MRRYLGESTLTQIKDWFVNQCCIELGTVRNKEDLRSQKNLIKKVIQKMKMVVPSQEGIQIDDEVVAEVNAIKKKLNLSGSAADRIATVIFLIKDSAGEITEKIRKYNKKSEISARDFYQVMMEESFKYKDGNFRKSLNEEKTEPSSLASEIAKELGYINEFDEFWAENPEINKIEVANEINKKKENRMRKLNRRGFREADLSDVADIYMRKLADNPDFPPNIDYGYEDYDYESSGDVMSQEEINELLSDIKYAESRMRRSSRRFRESEDEVLVMKGEKVGLVIEKSTGRGMSAPKTVKKSFVAPGDLGEKGIVGLIMLALKRKPMELNGNVTFEGLEEVMRDECADGSDFVSKIVLPNEVITLVD